VHPEDLQCGLYNFAAYQCEIGVFGLRQHVHSMFFILIYGNFCRKTWEMAFSEPLKVKISWGSIPPPPPVTSAFTAR